MDKNELKSELARKYYSEDANCLSDFIDILDEYEKLTSDNSGYTASPKLPICPYDGDCDVSTKENGIIYCERMAGICDG
jgi:hypothetical protein